MAINETKLQGLTDTLAKTSGPTCVAALLAMISAGCGGGANTKAAESLQTLLDEDYSFDQQKFVPLNPPITLTMGDLLKTACTYQNPGPSTLTFGESTSKNEMCILMVYRYPAVATTFNCAM